MFWVIYFCFLHIYYSARERSYQEILFKEIDYNRISDEKVKEIEGEIFFEEIQKVVNNLKLGKSPGQDGFTAEYFKLFIKDVGIYLSRSLNSA